MSFGQRLTPSTKLNWLGGLMVMFFMAAVLSPMHRLPVPSFLHEWLLAAGMLLTAVLAIKDDRFVSLRFDALSALILFLFVVVLFQAGFGLAQIPAAGLYLSYLFLAFVAYQIGILVAASQYRVGLVNFLALALFLAALYSCLCAAFQLSHWPVVFDLVYPPNEVGVYGNLAQANHFNDLLWLGVLAALHLNNSGKVRRVLVVFCIALFIAFSVLSASRTSFLYALAVLLLPTVFNKYFTCEPKYRNSDGAWIFVLFILTFALFKHFGVSEYFGFDSLSRRVTELGKGSAGVGGRFGLWSNIISAIGPLGSGAGNFRQTMRELPELWLNTGFVSVPEHAHNVLLDVAFELGWIVFVVFVAVFARWFWVRRKGRMNAEHRMAFGVLVIVGIHSMLEYPIYYVLFLVPFFIALGLLSSLKADSSEVLVKKEWPMAVLMTALVLLGLGYKQFQIVDDVFFHLQYQMTFAGQTRLNVIGELDSIPTYSPVRPYSSLVKAMMADPQDIREGLIEKDCDNAVRVWLSPNSLANCAASYALHGEGKKAMDLLSSVCRMVPRSGTQVWRQYNMLLGGHASGVRPAYCSDT